MKKKVIKKKTGPKPMPSKRKVNMSFCVDPETAFFLHALQNRSEYITKAVKFAINSGVPE